MEGPGPSMAGQGPGMVDLSLEIEGLCPITLGGRPGILAGGMWTVTAEIFYSATIFGLFYLWRILCQQNLSHNIVSFYRLCLKKLPLMENNIENYPLQHFSSPSKNKGSGLKYV
jgi:hypothetical protein